MNMKRNRILPGLLALALAASAAACAEPAPAPVESVPPSPAQTAAPAPTPAPTPAPPAEDPVWGEQLFARDFAAGDGALVLSVKYALPMIQNTDACPAGPALNAWYQTEGAQRMREAEESYEMAVADYDVSSVSGLPFTPTVQEMDFEITRQDGAYISVARTFYTDFGGAHPFVARLSETFDAATGAKLGFSDFFSDADAVIARVERALLAHPDLSGSISSGGLTAGQVAAAFQPENFYLSEDGFVFWVQGGDLPAVNGPLEVTIPYDQLEDVRLHG